MSGVFLSFISFISQKELDFPSGNDFYDSGWHGYAPEHDEMASPLLAYGPRK